MFDVEKVGKDGLSRQTINILKNWDIAIKASNNQTM